MTIILAAETANFNRYMILVTIPPYRPSILAGVIVALLLAVAGLTADMMIFPTPGIVALTAAIVAAGICWGLVGFELRRALCFGNLCL